MLTHEAVCLQVIDFGQVRGTERPTSPLLDPVRLIYSMLLEYPPLNSADEFDEAKRVIDHVLLAPYQKPRAHVV